MQRGKGGRARTVRLLCDAGPYIEWWLDKRRELGIGARALLFCTIRTTGTCGLSKTTQGGAMHTSYVRTLLPRLARKAGIAKRVHAHGPRHAHATRLHRQRVPLAGIRAQLGHSRSAITWQYLEELSGEEALELLDGVEWSIGRDE